MNKGCSESSKKPGQMTIHWGGGAIKDEPDKNYYEVKISMKKDLSAWKVKKKLV